MLGEGVRYLPATVLDVLKWILMKLMKFKKFLLFSLPVLGGISFAWLALPKLGRGEAKKNFQERSLAPKKEISLTEEVAKPISYYLLSSQTLFSKAIELASQNNQKTDNNQGVNPKESDNARIVQLINEAIGQATEAVLHYPTDPRGYAQRAKIYQAIEKYLPEATKVALADWEKAASLSSNDPQYFKSASDLALKINDFQKALFCLEKASEVAPTEAQILFDLAQLENKLGLLTEAKKDYQRVLGLVVSREQKELIEKELKAIDSLLAQSPKSVIKESLETTSKKEAISLPDNPPKLEAKNLTNRIFLADPSEKKDLLIEDFADSNAFSGIGVLPGGTTKITIMNNIINNNSQVYLTPIGDSQNQILRVSQKKPASGNQPGSFTVTIPQALNHDLEFKWWIIN